MVLVALPLMKNLLTPLARSDLVLRLMVATSEIDTDIQEKIYGSDIAALIISNEEMEHIM